MITIADFSPETQIAFVPLLWVGVPVAFMLLTGQGLCKPAMGWWAVSLPVYLGWLAFNNPIASDAVRSLL